MADEDHLPPPEPPGPQAGGRRTGPEPGRGAGTETVRLTAWVRGRVQGVGFRWWVRSRALPLGLRGWAENLPDGRVKVVAEGPGDRCAQLLALLGGPDTPGHVIAVTHRWDEPSAGPAGFAER